MDFLIPVFQAIGNYVVQKVVDEAGNVLYNIFFDDDNDGEPDSDTPWKTITDDSSENDTITIIDNDDDVELITEVRVDQTSGIYGAMCQVVGVPVTRDQENILLCGSIVILIGGCYSIFKIVNYLFHI